MKLLIFAISLFSFLFLSPSNYSSKDYHNIRKEAIDNANGIIKGKVLLKKGKIRNILNVIKDEKTCGGKDLIDESLLTSDDGGLLWAVISIDSEIKGGKTFEECPEAKVLNQKSCTFQPHVLVVGKNCPMIIKNSDPTLHNVRTSSFINPTINKLQMYIPGKAQSSDEIVFEEAEVVKVMCDVHGWMKAYVHVVDNPYNVVTDANGEFVMEDVPPGKYKLKVWHEMLGSQTKNIEVVAGQTSAVNFTFK